MDNYEVQKIYERIASELNDIMFARGFCGIAEDYLSYVATTANNESIEVAISVKTDSLQVHAAINGESGGMKIDNYRDILDDQKFISMINEVAI